MTSNPIGIPTLFFNSFQWLFSLALAFLITGTTLIGQNSIQQQAGYYTFGLNAGSSYQSSDVRPQFEGFGLGATLAKNLYYKPGAPISFDLRGRLLYARQFGLDGLRSFDIEENKVLNGSQSLDYLNYPAGLAEPEGFVFQNHQTDVFELGLEGVITLNKLRERTGVVASIFGGLGIDWYQTKIDQAGANGQAYYQEYAGLDQQITPSAIRSQLKSAILDGDYESFADGFDQEGGKIGLMPSLGLELGFDLTPNFSIHAGHRFTFSGNDIMDGHQWADPNNDIYHYTNLALRWKIKPKESRMMAPVIDIITPAAFPFNSPIVNGLIRARIKHIQGAANVTCTINGRNQSFTFNKGQFSKPFLLQNGENEIIITATNSVGTDQERIIIFYQEETPPPPPGIRPPDIIITQPSNQSTSVNTPNFTLRASINEVNRKDQIKFLLNGRSHNFNFNRQNGQFQVNINLEKGENRIQIDATNTAGKDSETAIIIYQAPRPSRLPEVRITAPNNGYRTKAFNTNIQATLKYVNSRSDIEILLNGQYFSDFSFSNGSLRANIPLQIGTNRVIIQARNVDGQAEDQISIVRDEEVILGRAPQVNIQRPANYSTTDLALIQVQASISEIDQASDIQMLVNGQPFFNFNFNRSQRQLTANVQLIEGNNNIQISAMNARGTDSDQVYISYRRATPPNVRITQPSDNSTFNNERINFRATVQDIVQKGQIELALNGQRIYNFNFSTIQREVTASLNLRPGNNTVSIRVSNANGQAEDQVYVQYRQAEPPTIRIDRPINNSTTQTAQIELSATTTKVSNKGQVQIWLNGQSINNFNLNLFRGQITANLRLRAGNNRIRVSVQNNDGSQEDEVNVNYQEAKPPSVAFTNPANNSISQSERISAKASTQNVESRNQIQLWLSGNPISNFGFQSARQEVNVQLVLVPGNNTLRIKVDNGDGNAEDRININYHPPKPPQVSISQPQNGANLSNNTTTLTATTQFVERKEEITILLNGKTVTDFSWSENTINTNISGLKPGNNTITVKVGNKNGADEASVSLAYTPAVGIRPPIVRFITPAEEEITHGENVYLVKAVVNNVTSTDQIRINVNRSPIKQFDFNPRNGEISFQMPLKNPRNTVSIFLTTEGGTANARRIINYVEKQPEGNLPFVRIESVSQPTINPLNPGVARSTITATVKNVNAQQISLKVNDRNITEFTYNAKSGFFQCTFPLERGENRVVLSAESPAGQDRGERRVTF